MNSFFEFFLDLFPTDTTLLTGIVRRDSNSGFPKLLSKMFNPQSELIPASIRYCPGTIVAFDHIPNSQIFVGYQVVRLTNVTRKSLCVFDTLPTYS